MYVLPVYSYTYFVFIWLFFTLVFVLFSVKCYDAHTYVDEVIDEVLLTMIVFCLIIISRLDIPFMHTFFLGV